MGCLYQEAWHCEKEQKKSGLRNGSKCSHGTWVEMTTIRIKLGPHKLWLNLINGNFKKKLSIKNRCSSSHSKSSSEVIGWLTYLLKKSCPVVCYQVQISTIRSQYIYIYIYLQLSPIF